MPVPVAAGGKTLRYSPVVVKTVSGSSKYFCAPRNPASLSVHATKRIDRRAWRFNCCSTWITPAAAVTPTPSSVAPVPRSH